MRDELGDRMKELYENRTRILLPRRTYTIIRIDGKCFSSYTKGCEKPFDMGLVDDMNETAKYLCKNIQGAEIGFVQSDEISILLTDFATHQTEAWFDGNIQKIVSVAASMATAKFNQLRFIRLWNETNIPSDQPVEPIDLWNKLAEFDARTFTIPSKTEIMNYFIWRQQDTVRNSISSVAQDLYSTKELDGKNMSVQQEMIFQKGINWNNYDSVLKRGRFIFKERYDKQGTERTRWVAGECPTFSKEPEFLDKFI
ncbi:MAG: tRNA(His) guanylyltransferase Thg1 family protein [Bacteroidales bacterium]|jgi:tRNA(His) guanylyltransferase|nr:tRNA(His) guanylyltransferase Thg1 family protein [Bacteroidales bacterium]